MALHWPKGRAGVDRPGTGDAHATGIAPAQIAGQEPDSGFLNVSGAACLDDARMVGQPRSACSCSHAHACREAAAGNDLSSGLKQCFAFLADLRRFSKAQPSVPATHWGNAFGIQFVMPLSLAPPHETPAPGRVDFQEILALAACAINTTLKDAREDPAAVANVLNFFGSTMHKGFFKEELDAPGFSPTRDMICGVSSWRNQSVEKVDFGQGRPWAVAGKLPSNPSNQKQWHKGGNAVRNPFLGRLEIQFFAILIFAGCYPDFKFKLKQNADSDSATCVQNMQLAYSVGSQESMTQHRISNPHATAEQELGHHALCIKITHLSH